MQQLNETEVDQIERELREIIGGMDRPAAEINALELGGRLLTIAGQVNEREIPLRLFEALPVEMRSVAFSIALGAMVQALGEN